MMRRTIQRNMFMLMPAEAEQSIEYNTFNKASRITRNNPDLQLVLHYGPGEQRIKTEQKSNGQTILTKYFPGDGLEIEVSATGEERWLHYLPGGGLYVCDKDFNEIGMYYVLSDYLGSWHKVITPTGATIEEYSFDPWGRRRNPENRSHTGVSATFVFDRGFTGHEMLDPFGLVNMNGRMYDPLLGRMLSPDNYVQSPGSTQGFNRYSYALNNPLVYMDPSGDNPAIIAMIAYSAIVSGLSSAENGDGFIDGFAMGAATSAISFGVGEAIGPVVAGGTRLTGMANAGINAAVADVITNGMNALVSNNAFNWKAYGLNIATTMAFAGLAYQKPGNDEFTIGETVSKEHFFEYADNAKRYNAKLNKDDLLKARLKFQTLKLRGSLKVTSKVPEGQGLTPDGKYVKWQGTAGYGKVILGNYVNPILTMYISPYVCNANYELFSLVYTHEFIHYFQWQKYGESITTADREFEAHTFNAAYYGSHNMVSQELLELQWLKTHPATTGGFIANPKQYSNQINY